MKVRARTNGNVIELDEATATELIDRGIYEAVADTAPPLDAVAPLSPKPAPTPKSPAPPKPTKVTPLTTDDMPPKPTRTPPRAA